jgi:hypothetical protein
MLRAMTDAPERLSCRAACLAVGEPLLGSAAEAPLFAAVSWPKPRWHADKIVLSDGLPAELGALAKSLGKKLQLRLMQRAGSADPARVELVCADFASGRSAALDGLAPSDAAGRIAAFAAGEAIGPALARPLVLVCTDGKHDACCGKLGRSLLLALRAAGVDAVEASHLGGHRLAANALVLPTGELYGRVEPEDVPKLVEALQHGRVYARRLRGRSGRSEAAQLAEGAALARFPAATHVRVAGAESARGPAHVELLDGDVRRSLEVRCVLRAFTAIASCGDAEPERRERWVVESVREQT